ncbi:MAG TPA: TonB-dependent receptor, partial [Gammaproteobacteria bacterium]|nr:TonB-dependent receptor [Gammaproteobacteria bacterium]
MDFGRPCLNHDTINARSETLLSTKFETRVNDRVQLFLKAYRHTWDTDYTRIYNVLDDNGNLTGETRVVNDDTYWGYKDYGFNAMLEWAVAPQADLVVGFDQQNYRAEDDVWRIADEKEQVNAVFAQVRSTPQLFENTVLALGVRNNRPSESRDSTVWNLSGKHALSDRWYVQGNLGTSFRLPDAEALFL